MGESERHDLFISYRREGGVDYARMIYLELKGRGYKVFFDYNSLRDGKFNEAIFKAIDDCSYFLLVLSTGALERCQDDDDWVRHEIEYALSKGKTIIPICPSGNARNFPERLPTTLEPLRHLQISALQMDDLFEKSFDKIVEDRFAAKFRARRGSGSGSGFVRFLKRKGLILLLTLVVLSIIGGCFVRARHRLEEKRRQDNELREQLNRLVDEQQAQREKEASCERRREEMRQQHGDRPAPQRNRHPADHETRQRSSQP